MIIDTLSNATLYSGLSSRIQQAFAYLQQTDLENAETGKYEIDGTNVFALVQEYESKPMAEGKWEAHRRYIDVQYIVRGNEQIGYVHISHLTPGDYDADRDFLPLTGEGEYLTLFAGDFMLLFPDDGHMPGLVVGGSGPVKKVVVKVAVE